jgi:hypothetical protein
VGEGESEPLRGGEGERDVPGDNTLSQEEDIEVVVRVEVTEEVEEAEEGPEEEEGVEREEEEVEVVSISKLSFTSSNMVIKAGFRFSSL